MTPDNVIGIVGGMGPEAGLTLFNCILSRTGAGTDQEHASVVLMSFPGQIADRTAFLQGRAAANPGRSVAGIIAKLESTGARVVGIACNTCHAPVIYDLIRDELRAAGSRVKLLHMPGETCRYLRAHYPYVRRVGVLATNGTSQAGIYADLLHGLGYEVVAPDAGFQNGIIHRMIYDPAFGLKANPSRVTPEVRALMEEAMAFFASQRTEVVIFGCTELSLLRKEWQAPGSMAVIDSTEALALALLREAGYAPAPLGEMFYLQNL